MLKKSWLAPARKEYAGAASRQGTEYLLSLLQPFGCQRLPTCDQRMSNCMHRECDAILHAHLAHQLANKRLHRSFFDSKSGSDFLVCVPGNKQFQHFLFAISEHDVTGGKDISGRGTHTLDEHRKYTTRRPYRTLMYCTDRLGEL